MGIGLLYRPTAGGVLMSEVPLYLDRLFHVNFIVSDAFAKE